MNNKNSINKENHINIENQMDKKNNSNIHPDISYKINYDLNDSSYDEDLDEEDSFNESSGESYELVIADSDKGIRIDKYIAKEFERYSRSFIQKLINENLILVNDQNIKSKYKLRLNDHIRVSIPPPEVIEIRAEDMALDVIYEDEDIIVINKERGIVTHPAAGHYSGTLVNGLLYHYQEELSTVNGILRPGIVHRLDMDTTGALIVCKNNHAHMSIAKQFKNHTVTRKYHAIVNNVFKHEEGTIDEPIGRHPVERKRMAINYDNGKKAITHYKVIENLNNNFAYLECSLETGRTHQIRVHMASICHPIVGDKVYGPKNRRIKTSGQALHARVIGFIHPTQDKYMEFIAPLPDNMNKLLSKLGNNS